MVASVAVSAGVLGIVSEHPIDATEADDQALARRAAAGDRDAFSQLVRQSQRAVYGLCYRLVGGEHAADAAQESFVRAYAALASFDPRQRFDVWVLRIARNHCYDLLRRRGYAPERDEEAVVAAADPSPSVEDKLEQAQANRDLEAALGALGARDREILDLYYVQHRKTREIGEIVGLAPGSVMARLFRAREKLRKILTEAA